MNAVANDYGEMLREKQPRVVKSEDQNERYIEYLRELCSNPNPTNDERDLADLLTVLIEDFEEKHYRLSTAAPLDVIRELMDARGLRQKDLVDVFGTTSIVSEVLNGKRQISLDHVRRLSRKFNVPSDVFIAE
jgi:HTH-type transcriptional regulator/antitoxin HigA